MTLFEYSMMLQDVAYKPGWSFQLRDAAAGFVTLEIQCPVIDSAYPSVRRTIAISYHFHVMDYDSEARFLGFVRACTKRTEGHEFNEFFRVRGEPWPVSQHATF